MVLKSWRYSLRRSPKHSSNRSPRHSLRRFPKQFSKHYLFLNSSFRVLKIRKRVSKIERRFAFTSRSFIRKQAFFGQSYAMTKILTNQMFVYNLLSLNYYCNFSLKVLALIILFSNKKLYNFNNISKIFNKKYPMSLLVVS